MISLISLDFLIRQLDTHVGILWCVADYVGYLYRRIFYSVKNCEMGCHNTIMNFSPFYCLTTPKVKPINLK